MSESARFPDDFELQVGIVSAMSAELRGLKKNYPPLVFRIVTGIGQRNVYQNLSPFLQNRNLKLIIHLGFAGALSNHLHPGDLLVIHEIREGHGKEIFQTDQTWLNRALTLKMPGMQLISGLSVCSQEMIISASSKSSLISRLGIVGPACVDTETAAVARICQEQRIPLLSIRSISDGMEEDLPLDFNRCRDNSGNICLWRVLWQTLKKPQSLVGLNRLRRSTRLCSRNLGQFVNTLLERNFP